MFGKRAPGPPFPDLPRMKLVEGGGIGWIKLYRETSK